MTAPLNIVVVALGGGLGAVLRFLTSCAVTARYPLVSFPLGTFLINFAGCVCIGVISGLSSRFGLPEHWRLFLITGILGGFTTFSAFGLETVALLRAGDFTQAFLYAIGSVVCGCLGVWVALLLTESSPVVGV
jgi:CrcB protein